MSLAPNPTKRALRVLLLEDNETDAGLISHQLERFGVRTVVERVDSEESFIAALRSFGPDVVLSNHSVDHFDSLGALEILRAVRPIAPFIIVTDSVADTDAQTCAAIRAGAEDLVFKTKLSGLDAAISEALAVRRPLHRLSERQVQVLRLVAEGLRTREIARQLGLSVKTVESHRGEIMKRLGIHDLVGLARYAIRVGLVAQTS